MIQGLSNSCFQLLYIMFMCIKHWKRQTVYNTVYQCRSILAALNISMSVNVFRYRASFATEFVNLFQVELRQKNTVYTYYDSSDEGTCLSGDCGTRTQRSVNFVTSGSYGLSWTQYETKTTTKLTSNLPFEMRWDFRWIPQIKHIAKIASLV